MSCLRVLSLMKPHPEPGKFPPGESSAWRPRGTGVCTSFLSAFSFLPSSQSEVDFKLDGGDRKGSRGSRVHVCPHSLWVLDRWEEFLVCFLGFCREGFLRPVLPPTFAESKAAVFSLGAGTGIFPGFFPQA